MKKHRVRKKGNLHVSKIRRYLEPGPIVLVSSAWKDELNIMTMGWHMVMGFQPSLIGCYIWDANHSSKLIQKSRECVFNIPTFDMIETVIGIGNTSGRSVDKFETFGLTPQKAAKIRAPLIGECYASFECKLYESSLTKKYNFFVFEVVKAHVAATPKYPKTVHYRGEGVFMLSGPSVSYRQYFKKQNL